MLCDENGQYVGAVMIQAVEMGVVKKLETLRIFAGEVFKFLCVRYLILSHVLAAKNYVMIGKG